MHERILSQHKCRAVVVTCIDFRFAGARTSLAIEKAYGLHENEYDVIVLPGGAQNLTQFQLTAEYKGATRHALGIAIDLHNIRLVIVLSHQNCGALKAIGKAFSHEEADVEKEFHRILLLEAAGVVRGEWPRLAIEAGYLYVEESQQIVTIEKIS